MKNKRIICWVVILLAIDILTIGVIGKVYTDYLHTTKTNTIVKMDEWGIDVETAVNTITTPISNGISLTYPFPESLVYPGEESEINVFKINGTPNANIKLSCDYTISVKDTDNWIISDKDDNDYFYFPVKFKLANDDGEYNSIDLTTENNEYAYPTQTIQLKKGVNYNEYDIGIDWKWDFETLDEDGNIETYDAYDTALGNYPTGEAPRFEIMATLKMEWDDGKYPSSGSDPEPDPGDDSDDDVITTVSVTSGAAPILPERTLSGDAGQEDEAILPPGLTLSGSVNTGDNFNIIFWVGLMTIATATIIAVIVLLIRRRNQEKANIVKEEA